MEKISGLIFIIYLSGLSVFADIPPPAPAKEMRIQLQQNYPDYQFYIALYDLKVVPDPKSILPSLPNKIVEIEYSFQTRLINLGVENSYSETPTSKRIHDRSISLIGNRLWLVAVNKSVDGDIKAKIKAAIDRRKSGDGIYIGELAQSDWSKNDVTVGVEIVVNTVTKLGEQGLTIDVTEASPTKKTNNQLINWIGVGLGLTGLSFFGFWQVKKLIDHS